MTHETIRLILMCWFIFKLGTSLSTKSHAFIKDKDTITFVVGIIVECIIYGLLITLTLQI